MKKFLALLLALTMVLALAACNGGNTDPSTEAPNPSTEATTPSTEATEPSTEATEPSEGGDDVQVMTHDQFVAAELDTAVVVETYVQAVESWYKDACHIYAQSEDGGYYIYSYACTEDEAAKLVPGTKIRVSGYKSEWSGEVEITEATIEILEGSYTATATDVTSLMGTDALADHMNALVSFKGLTVAASKDAEGKDAAFLYSWDGSGEAGNSDLYFNVTDGTTTYTFTINMYMIGTGPDSDVYKAVEALQIGDKIDIEGFLYWYNGAQTHVTSVTPAA